MFPRRGVFSDYTVLFTTRARLEEYARPTGNNGSAKAPQIGLSFAERSYEVFPLRLMYDGKVASTPTDQLVPSNFLDGSVMVFRVLRHIVFGGMQGG